jgi:hypothetical protein
MRSGWANRPFYGTAVVVSGKHVAWRRCTCGTLPFVIRFERFTQGSNRIHMGPALVQWSKSKPSPAGNSESLEAFFRPVPALQVHPGASCNEA